MQCSGGLAQKRLLVYIRLLILKNNMVYIGQSTNVKNRLKAHIQASVGISTIAGAISTRQDGRRWS